MDCGTQQSKYFQPLSGLADGTSGHGLGCCFRVVPKCGLLHGEIHSESWEADVVSNLSAIRRSLPVAGLRLVPVLKCYDYPLHM